MSRFNALNPPSIPRLWLSAAAALAALALAGCASQRVAAVSDDALPFDQATVQATDVLVQQSQVTAGLMARLSKRQVVLDPTLDAGTGQQTAATQQLDQAIADRVTRNHEQIEILPFRPANLSKAQYLLTGTLARDEGAYRVNLALVDLRSGAAVAQASARARSEGIDMSPLAYYRDSPVLVKDKVIDGYVRTSTTAAGQQADPTYLERIAAATVINDATVLYNAERYQEALGQYRSALATPAGDQLRVLNGIYLSSVKLGQMAEAEEAFGRVVAFGIAYNELGVKLLFNPGGTEFWSDPKVSGVYGMWLRQIARESGQRQGLHGHHRAHEQDRLGGVQRCAVAQARGLHQAAPERRVGRSGPAGRACRAWDSGRTSLAAARTTAWMRWTAGSSSGSCSAAAARPDGPPRRHPLLTSSSSACPAWPRHRHRCRAR